MMGRPSQGLSQGRTRSEEGGAGTGTHIRLAKLSARIPSYATEPTCWEVVDDVAAEVLLRVINA